SNDVASLCSVYVTFFFFQAEDGIRDFHVTGVQTCALPILPVPDAAIKLDAQAEIDRIAAAPDHVLAAVDVDGDPKTADSEVRSYDADKRTWTPIAKDGATDPIYPLG